MVTPDRRRRAVVVLQEPFGVSERRACRVVGQHRSTQRRCPRAEPAEDAKLRRRLRQFAREHPRLSWRKAHAVVSQLAQYETDSVLLFMNDDRLWVPEPSVLCDAPPLLG